MAEEREAEFEVPRPRVGDHEGRRDGPEEGLGGRGLMEQIQPRQDDLLGSNMGC